MTEQGHKSVDTPDMRSAAELCLVGAELLVQLLANPANAVVEASESAASKLGSGTRLPASDASELPACTSVSVYRCVGVCVCLWSGVVGASQCLHKFLHRVAPVVEHPVSLTSDDASFSDLVSNSWRPRVLSDRPNKEACKGPARPLTAPAHFPHHFSTNLLSTKQSWPYLVRCETPASGCQRRFTFAVGLMTN